jgi:hypothetical protein
MIKYITILLLGLLVIACNQKTNQSEETPAEENVNPLVNFIPETKESIQIDTVLKDLNLKISIIQTPTNTYLSQEYEIDSVMYTTNYRDLEQRLIIKKGDQILMDTTFSKQTFISYSSQEFFNEAIFSWYSFTRIEESKLEFFGAVAKPETDWAFAFNHYYDLKTGAFEVKEQIFEEE